MNNRKILWNGIELPESEAKVSCFDSAMMYGDTIFEMTRSFKNPHNQFQLKEHIDRLYNSAKYISLNIPITKSKMIEDIHKTIDINLNEIDGEHRIMINITRGLLSIYEDVVGVEKGINIIIADFPLKWTVSSMGHLFDEGINAVIPSQRAIPARLLEPKIKNRSRIHYLKANIEVAQTKGKNNWALLLDEDGFVAEGTGDNFFIVKNGVVITPEGRNILRGISRDYIFELCEQLKIKCIEKNIEPYDVLTADEAFMTGTPFCMLPVTKLNGQEIGNGKIGINFSILIDQWSENVGIDIIQQIKNYNSDKKNGITPYQF